MAGGALFGSDGAGQVRLNPLSQLARLDDVRSPRGGSFYHINGVSTVQTLVTPAANTAGLTLRRFSGYFPGGSGQVGIFADTSAPSGISDTTKHAIALLGGSNTGPLLIAFSIFIPAGVGLYVAPSISMNFAASFDL